MEIEDVKNKVIRFFKSAGWLIVSILIFVLFTLNFNEYYRIGQLFLMIGIAGFIYNLIDDWYFKEFDTLKELKNGNIAVGLFVLGVLICLSVCIIAIHL